HPRTSQGPEFDRDLPVAARDASMCTGHDRGGAARSPILAGSRRGADGVTPCMPMGSAGDDGRRAACWSCARLGRREMRRDRNGWALAALVALGLLIWLARDPLFARDGGAAPPDGPVAAAAGLPEAAPMDARPSVASPAGAAKIPVIFLPNAGQT